MTALDAHPMASTESNQAQTRAPGLVLALLAGGAAPSPLAQALGCSLLDVEIAPGVSVLEWWCSRSWGEGRLPTVVRSVRGIGSPAPRSSPSASGARFEDVADRGGPRGSAGAVRDACGSDDPSDTVIVAECSTLVTSDLGALLAGHEATGAPVSVVATVRGRPAGLVFLSRSSLEAVKPRGFVDLKEQFLATLAAAGTRIAVLRVPDQDVHPMHDRRGLLGAAMALRAKESGLGSPGMGPCRLGLMPSVIGPGAEVAPDAVVSGSLVMSGARIGARAVVARCVVGPGGAVGADRQVLDAIIVPDRTITDEHLPRERRRKST